MDSLASPLNVAIGTEARREGYKLFAGEPDSYRFGGVAGGRPADRRRRPGVPGLPSGQRDRHQPHRDRRVCRPRSEPDAAVAGVGGDPRRALLGLRQQPGRQAGRPLRLQQAVRPARLAAERLPRAVAAAAELHRHLDQLHRRRAVRDHHLQADRPGRRRARRPAAEGRKIGQRLARRGDALQSGQRHRRRLPHRRQGPHRPVGEPDCRPACATTSPRKASSASAAAASSSTASTPPTRASTWW